MGWSQVQDVRKKLGTCIHAKFRPNILLLISKQRRFLRCPELPFCRLYGLLCTYGFVGSQTGFCVWLNKYIEVKSLMSTRHKDIIPDWAAKYQRLGECFKKVTFALVFNLLEAFPVGYFCKYSTFTCIYGVQHPEAREAENPNLLKNKIIHCSLALPTNQKSPQW